MPRARDIQHATPAPSVTRSDRYHRRGEIDRGLETRTFHKGQTFIFGRAGPERVNQMGSGPSRLGLIHNNLAMHFRDSRWGSSPQMDLGRLG